MMDSSGGDILVKLGGYVYSIDLTNEILGGIDDQTPHAKSSDQTYDTNNNVKGWSITDHGALVANKSESLTALDAPITLNGAGIGDLTNCRDTETDNEILYKDLSSVFLEYLEGSNRTYSQEHRILPYDLNKSCENISLPLEQYVEKHSVHGLCETEHAQIKDLDQQRQYPDNSALVQCTMVIHSSEYRKDFQSMKQNCETRYEHPQGICIEQVEQRDINLCQRCKCEVKQHSSDPLEPDMPNIQHARVHVAKSHIDYDSCIPSFDEFQTEMKANEYREFDDFLAGDNIFQEDTSPEQKQYNGSSLLKPSNHLCANSQNSVFLTDHINQGMKERAEIDKIRLNNQFKRGAQLEKDLPTEPLCLKSRRKLDRGCKIWEFIRDLLLNPETNPSLIRWENKKEGTFRLVQPKTISKLWGQKKGNLYMNYEKLSRALRYHYKRRVLTPVKGKNLIYKFGPSATGWRE